MTASPASLPDLAHAREALARREWSVARHAFEAAVAERELPEAYEGLSWAAWWQNDFDALHRARETAFRLYRQGGDDLGAARMAMWLAADYADFRGELSVASGWRQRARRLLDDLPLAAEHGWAHLLAGDAALLFEGDTESAIRGATSAMEIGRTLGVPDFGILGLALHGLALVEQGQVATGMSMLEEAAVGALGEGLTEQFWVSWALCYLLFACERARDFDRAAQWCERLRQHAQRYDIPVSMGVCRVHYAAVLIWRGDWAEAEEQLTDAASLLEALRPPYAAEAFMRLGELRRRQGRLEEATEIFGRAEWHPLALFGLAELALDAARPRDAAELIERALRQIPETSRHQLATALELLTRAHALLGHHRQAQEKLAELEQLSGAIQSPPLRAAAALCAGIAHVAAGNFDEARAQFEDASSLFERAGAPYELGRAKLELASVLVELGRLDRARSEATAALDALERLGSRLYARRAAALLRDIERRAGQRASRQQRSELTARQRDVLRLIARGRSDREIAAELGVSGHTVHRHVANILLRLDTPNRAAAAALAASQGLL